ncbi:MAG: hypothetical protein ACLR56_08240 [Oscillospiraceae bacterium]
MGFDKTPKICKEQTSRKEDWEFTVKMCVIIKDLMNGNKTSPRAARKRL